MSRILTNVKLKDEKEVYRDIEKIARKQRNELLRNLNKRELRMIIDSLCDSIRDLYIENSKYRFLSKTIMWQLEDLTDGVKDCYYDLANEIVDNENQTKLF